MECKNIGILNLKFMFESIKKGSLRDACYSYDFMLDECEMCSSTIIPSLSLQSSNPRWCHFEIFFELLKTTYWKLLKKVCNQLILPCDKRSSWWWVIYSKAVPPFTLIKSPYMDSLKERTIVEPILSLCSSPPFRTKILKDK